MVYYSLEDPLDTLERGAHTSVFPARYESLAEICNFVTQAARNAGLDEGAIYSVNMAVDEACSNIIEHAYGHIHRGTMPREASSLHSPTEEIIEIACIDNLEAFTIVLEDHGKPFDPGSVPRPDIHQSIEQRPTGGLGLFFIRQLMDEVRFEFIPGASGLPNTNILILVKRKSSPSANTYAAIKRRAEQLASVIEVSQAVISILDLDQLLKELVNLIPRRLGYSYVQIFTVHPGRKKIHCV